MLSALPWALARLSGASHILALRLARVLGATLIAHPSILALPTPLHTRSTTKILWEEAARRGTPGYNLDAPGSPFMGDKRESSSPLGVLGRNTE